MTRRAAEWEPAELGVHLAAGGGRYGAMPAYVRRPHDEKLRAVLDPAVAGSRLVVVRGDCCTGKSRAAYEAVADRLADWPLEYPPTAAALAARLEAGIPAGTVLWLGELCRYADADDGAAALHRLADLLEGEGHLVITTVWPEQWEAYVAAAGARRGAGDPVQVAGRLVAGLDELAFYPDPDPVFGGVIDVPARFTAGELTAAAGNGDPVLAAAATAAGPDGRLTQYLAGVPGLLHRYDGPGGDRYGQAIITAAMDAARLGHAGPLPAVLLQDAVAGYLTGPPADAGADGAGHAGDWREEALAWGSAELDGTVRALGYHGDGYRVAGYLEQHGLRTRGDRLGPASLWDALVARAGDTGTGDTGTADSDTGDTGTGDLIRVGQAARDRGLYRHAAALWTAAVSAGSADAARRLVACLREVSPDDAARAARWAADRVRLDDPWDLARLLEELRAAGAGDAVRTLLDRDPASQVSVDHRWDAIELLRTLHTAGAAEAAEAVDALAARVVRHANLEHLPDVASILTALHAAGASDAIRALVARDPARHADAEEPEEAAVLLEALHAAGAGDAVRALAVWAANDADLGGPQHIARLLKALRTVGAGDAIRTLLARDPVAHGSFDDPWEAAALLAELRAAGAGDTIGALLDRIRDPASLSHVDYADSVAWLLEELRAAGAGEAIRTLLDRDPASHVEFYDMQAVGRLMAELRAAGADEGVRTLATRLADQTADLDNPDWLAEQLEEFRTAGGDEAVRILLDRDPAGHARLDHPGDVAWLLDELVAAGADDQIRVLLARDPGGQASVDHPQDVARLLAALRGADAGAAARALAARAAAGARLEDPQGVARLLAELRAAGDGDALRTLLDRDPAGQVSLGPDRQRGVARLLAALRAAGDGGAARALAARAAGAGMFDLAADRASFRFGREPDGAPSPPWRWAQVTRAQPLPGPGADLAAGHRRRGSV